MKATHYAVYGTVLIGIAMQLSGLHSWAEALTPAFVSGILLTIGAVIGGTYLQPPTKKG